MAFNWICITIAVLLCLCSFGMAAPYGADWNKFNELERTLKELAITVLGMNGVGGGSAGTADENFGEMEMNTLGNDAAAALIQFHV